MFRQGGVCREHADNVWSPYDGASKHNDHGKDCRAWQTTSQLNLRRGSPNRCYSHGSAPRVGRREAGFGKQLVDETILPQLDSHVGPVFEEIARAFVSRLVQAGELAATDVGSWWSTDGDHGIDIVGIRSRPTFVGSVEWRAALLGRDVYNNLADHAHALGVDDSIPWILVGRGGVERSLLKAMPHLRGLSARDLYRR